MPERKKPVNESKHSSPGRKRGKINVKVHGEEMVGAGLRTVSMPDRV